MSDRIFNKTIRTKMNISQNQSAKTISAYDEPVPIHPISHDGQHDAAQNDAQMGAENAFGTQNPLESSHVYSATSTPLTTITPADFLENENSIPEPLSTDSCNEDDLDEFQTIRNPINENHNDHRKGPLPYDNHEQMACGGFLESDQIKYPEQTLPAFQPKSQLLPPLPSKNNSYLNQTSSSGTCLQPGIVFNGTGAFGTSNHSTLRQNTLRPAFTSFENGVYNSNSLSRRSALGNNYSEVGWNAASYCSTLKQPPVFQRNCLSRNSSTQLQELIHNAQINNQQAIQNQHALSNQMAHNNKNNGFRSDDGGRNFKYLRVSRYRAIGIVGTTFLLGFLLGGILVMMAYADGWVQEECGVEGLEDPR